MLALYFEDGVAVIPRELNIDTRLIANIVSEATGDTPEGVERRIVGSFSEVPDGSHCILFCSKWVDFEDAKKRWMVMDNAKMDVKIYDDMNSKATLREHFSENMVPWGTFFLEQGQLPQDGIVYAQSMIRQFWSAVLRASHGVSGFGMIIINTMEELQDFLQKLPQYHAIQAFPALLIEREVPKNDIKFSPSCQATIHDDGKVSLIWAGIQTLNQHNQHEWNLQFLEFDTSLVTAMREMAEHVWAKYHGETWFHGLFGVDFLLVDNTTFVPWDFREVSYHGKIYKLVMVEVNARMTGSHAWLTIGSILKYVKDNITAQIWNGSIPFSENLRKEMGKSHESYNEWLVRIIQELQDKDHLVRDGQDWDGKMMVTCITPNGLQWVIISDPHTTQQKIRATLNGIL